MEPERIGNMGFKEQGARELVAVVTWTLMVTWGDDRAGV